jgi:hypothetical protein
MMTKKVKNARGIGGFKVSPLWDRPKNVLRFAKPAEFD